LGEGKVPFIILRGLKSKLERGDNMEMAKNCEKCNAQNLRYQEDMWGGYQNCFICGWEVMVWRVSEGVEYGLVKWQDNTGQRDGFGVHSASIGGAIPRELKRRLQGTTSDIINDTQMKF